MARPRRRRSPLFGSCLSHLVLCTIEPDFILIIAVMHGKRAPGYWKRRLQSKPLA